MGVQELLGELRSLGERGDHQAGVISKLFDLMMASQKRIYTAKLASTGNRASLSGLAGTGLDGTPAEGDVVLLKDQSTTSQNGLYKASAGAWSRLTDDSGGQIVAPGLVVTVLQGSTLADTQWEISSDGTNIGTDPVTFAQLGAGGGGGGPGTIFGKPVITYASSNQDRDQQFTVPDCEISKGQFSWSNKPNGATLRMDIHNQRTDEVATIVTATNTASGGLGGTANTPLVCQAGDRIDIHITDGDSDDSLNGANIWWSVTLDSP